MKIEEISIDCIHFHGDRPCVPHKKNGVKCSDCPQQLIIEKKILIIKLGAAGDVIRTTPLIHKIRIEHPSSKIIWLTEFPFVLPDKKIDLILNYDFKSVIYLSQCEFDILYNFDKDRDACALANTVRAKEKFGYILKKGVSFPANSLAVHKYETGLFDDIGINNKKSYLHEIFEMAGWSFNEEEYEINQNQINIDWNFDKSNKIIGLNTGCGDRWKTRLWPEKNWEILIKKIQSYGWMPVLLGGEQEHNKNLAISQKTGAIYKGYFDLPKLISLFNQMDLIVTQVTMALHIAIGLKKPVILMNNIFNPNEFHLYGRGEIISPSEKCECYFSNICKKTGNSASYCMQHINAENVFLAIKKWL